MEIACASCFSSFSVRHPMSLFLIAPLRSFPSQCSLFCRTRPVPSCLNHRLCTKTSPFLTLKAFDGDNAEAETSDEKGRLTLDQLDQQLASLRVEKTSAQQRPSVTDAKERLQHFEEKTPEWPEFSDGFLLYAGIGLLLLTVVNNVLFSIFVAPIQPWSASSQVTDVAGQKSKSE